LMKKIWCLNEFYKMLQKKQLQNQHFNYYYFFSWELLLSIEELKNLIKVL
jgi:hypothetical protein